MECLLFFFLRLAKTLFHDSNGIYFIRFVFFSLLFFFFVWKVFMKFFFCMATLSCIYLYGTLALYLCKAVRSISAKLAITFCLPSLYLLIYFLMEKPMYKLTNPTHYTHTHIIILIWRRKKQLNGIFSLPFEISKILTTYQITV